MISGSFSLRQLDTALKDNANIYNWWNMTTYRRFCSLVHPGKWMKCLLQEGMFHKSLGMPISQKSTPYNKLSTGCILQSTLLV
jgi:hypothetical protein